VIGVMAVEMVRIEATFDIFFASVYCPLLTVGFDIRIQRLGKTVHPIV
jgi:hypothetical protein